MDNFLPFDTSKYDDLPISVFIYKTVYDSNNLIRDFRIVYGNKFFIRDWQRRHRDKIFYGAYIVRDNILSDEVVEFMKNPAEHNFQPFSSYIQAEDIHIHFQPIENLPSPFGGFFLTDISDYQEKSARAHFIHSIKQMEIAGVLLQMDLDGKVECLYASKEFADMMECTVPIAMAMMSGKGFIATTHPDDRLSVKRMLRRRISEDGTKYLTIRKYTANNREIWCKVYYTFIDDFSDKYIYITYSDITTSRIYEQRLRSTYMSIGNNFYRETDKTLGILQVNLDKDKIEGLKGKDLFATDSVIRPYSEVLKLRAASYIIDTERDQFLQNFSIDSLIKKYLLGQNEISMYLFSRRKDGHYCYVKITAVLTRHPITGEIVAFISEQEAGNEKVETILLDKILAQQFDMVAYISNGNYGVVVGDAELIGKGSIFPLARTGNYEEYLQGQVLPVLHGDADEIKSMTDALKLTNIEKNLRDKEPYIVNIACEIDGGIYHKRLDFYTADPRANFFILLKSDTTEIQRKQIEQNEQLREALVEAKQANVAKTAFLSRISHEIRTPMNAIIGLDNIALHEQNISDTMRGHLEKIGTSAHYLLSLINDILDMSRIESGRVTLKNEEFSFRAFIEQIETLVETQCREKELTFSCLMSGAIKNYYIGDDTKLKQILVNILSNAVKFTDPGGSITLSVECTAQFENTSNFKFVVKDTGIGMNAEYLPKIFEPFSQEDDKNTSRYGGSGLGLAITKNIVEVMNGKISVESEKGKGTEVTIILPLKMSDRTEEISASAMHPQDFSVLIIDDDAIACDSAKTILQEVGISADTCIGAHAALEMIRLRHARRDEYNLILVDLRMPGRSGIELTREIRQIIGDEPTVIILTAFDWDDVEEEAIKAGVDTFMSKPLAATNVLYEFQQAFHRKKQIERKTEPVNLEGRKILIVEDMEINAEIMKMILEMNGMESEHAENGKIAVDMFTDKPPGYYDAILMDIRMPVMDGLQSTSAIRAVEREDAKKIPIIAMTANAFDEDVQRSLQAGMNAHLAKPVEPEILLQTLRDLIS